jgi:hypothetical protein
MRFRLYTVTPMTCSPERAMRSWAAMQKAGRITKTLCGQSLTSVNRHAIIGPLNSNQR